MYEAIKSINRLQPTKPLVIKSDKGLTTNKEEQVKLISFYFTGIFHKNAEPMPDTPPHEVSSPFTSNELKTAVSKMKISKTSGCDEIPLNCLSMLQKSYSNISPTSSTV